MVCRARAAVTAGVFAVLAASCGSTHPAPTAPTPAASAANTSTGGREIPGATSPATESRPPATGAQRASGPPDGPVPRAFRVQSVTFTSPTAGWVLGTASCASPPCTSVLRTRDSGHTWHGIPAPRVGLAPLGPGGGVSELRFADARNGWAFRPELWATHDGGANWHRLGIGTVEALAASAGHALAVVRSGVGVDVLRTDAGSDMWSRVASFPSSGAIQEEALAVSAASTWLAGQSGLYVSADGVHWTTATGSCGTRAAAGVQAAWLTSATDGILACGGQGAAGSQDKAVYGSSNQGRSFSLLGSAPRGGDLEAASANRRDTVLVAAASGASELYASFDRGRTYSTVLALDDGGVGWRDLGFTTDAQGVAVESTATPGRLFITRDGGHRWRVVRFTTG